MFTLNFFSEWGRGDVVCVLPVGSYEQHGPHLPPDVDVVIAVYLAKKIAVATGGKTLPPIYYTCSQEHSDFSETISVTCQALWAYLYDVLKSAVGKCGRVIIVAGHGGITHIVQQLALTINYELGGPFALAIPVWSYIKARDHAGTDETSIYLATGGKLVGEMREICEGDPKLFEYGPVSRFSKTGVMGCLKPQEVSPEQGEIMLEKALEKILQKVRDFLNYTS